MDFVDKLRFNPYPKLFIDKQPITRRVFISSKKIREIRSRLVCEEYALSMLLNGDEKKDERMDSEEVFNLEIPQRVLRDLNYAKSQLNDLIGKSQGYEVYSLACEAHNALHNAIKYLEGQVQSQKSD